jgi:hypothetical protein
MVDPETEYATVLDENSYIKNLLEAQDLATSYRRMSGDYDTDDE